MGEGILIYGRNRRYVNNLQDFATRVLRDGKERGSIFHFGMVNPRIAADLRGGGIELKSSRISIQDKTILKYIDHPKKAKGATIDTKRYRMAQNAIAKPKHIYRDTSKGGFVYIGSKKYSGDKVIKVVLQPNYKKKKRYYNMVTSIGIVNKANMNSPQYVKIK